MNGFIQLSKDAGPIGVFDSGYGGLTIYNEIQKLLPQYDYLYLGDNARTPYGTRSFDVVCEFTRQAVRYLFQQGCQLVILACNTASAKALRTIQQADIPALDPNRRVLGIIRPTVERVGEVTKSGHVGVLATEGTIKSHSYPLEIRKLYPEIEVVGEACPMWVPLVETNEYESEGADFFVKQHIDSLLARDPEIDTIILGCTHYPILMDKIRKYTPEGITLLTQGAAVASSLAWYLQRHPEMERLCTKGGKTVFCTTEADGKFGTQASLFLNYPVEVKNVTLV